MAERLGATQEKSGGGLPHLPLRTGSQQKYLSITGQGLRPSLANGSSSGNLPVQMASIPATLPWEVDPKFGLNEVSQLLALPTSSSLVVFHVCLPKVVSEGFMPWFPKNGSLILC